MSPKKYLMYISQNYSYAMLRPIQAEILFQGGEVKWFLEGAEVSPEYLKSSEKRLENISSIINWNPDVVLVPGNVVPSFIPGLKVGVFHGFNSGKRGDDAHFKIRDCFDLYCTQGPNTTRRFKLSAAQKQTFSVAETGWAMLDPLFTPIADNPYINTLDSRSTVLFCSTFTQELSCALEIFEKIKTLSQSGELRWLVQFHPKMPIEIVDKYKSIQNENLQFVETDNVIPLLQAADIMLCDTSSITTMFLLQKKPVVAYKNKTNDDCYIHINRVEEIKGAIDLALTKPAELMGKIDLYCKETHPSSDGNASRRVISACSQLVERGVGHLKKKPLNIIRQFKLRKKLNYWKW
jgi:CDP-glycerol glycerophosphotransferase (TagB/SpsB family)